jgi:hypothetical protein
LLCLALFFQAAAQSPPPPQSPGSPYQGWDRQLLGSSYYYFPINEGTDFFLQFSGWFWEMSTTEIHMYNTCRVHFHLSETINTLFCCSFNWKEHLTSYASSNLILGYNSIKQAIIIMISIDSE